jgi:hypothetical protein
LREAVVERGHGMVLVLEPLSPEAVETRRYTTPVVSIEGIDHPMLGVEDEWHR